MKELLRLDRILHALVCSNIVFTGLIFNWWIALVLVVIASFGKELWDMRPGGSGFDKWDLAGDFVGVIYAYIVYLLWLI